MSMPAALGWVRARAAEAPGRTAIALRHGVLHHRVVERDAEVGYVVLITLSNGMPHASFRQLTQTHQCR